MSLVSRSLITLLVRDFTKPLTELRVGIDPPFVMMVWNHE